MLRVSGWCILRVRGYMYIESERGCMYIESERVYVY